jgi:deoxyinosine 3'endonuclease (endonuclease V)
MAKIKVTEGSLIDWLFSDSDDLVILASRVVKQLQEKGVAKITVEEFYCELPYIPGFITENGDEDAEYSPEDVELIK